MTSSPSPTPGSIAPFPQPVDPSCRCVVARGHSPRVEMAFRGPAPVTCRVGSARDCDWWIQGRGLPDLAIELHWDGELLWVAERAGHGRATLDGERLGARFRAVAGAARLEVPGCALVLESSRPGVVIEQAPRSAPSAPPPVRSDVREVLRPPAMPGAAPLPSPLEALADEPTRAYQAAPSAPPPPSPAATLPGLAPHRPNTIVPPSSPAALRAGSLTPPPVPGPVDDLRDDPTIEVRKGAPRQSGPVGTPGAVHGSGQSRGRRASTGG